MIVKPSSAAVIDNNVIVSAIINPFSPASRCIFQISQAYRLITSTAIAEELRSVLVRPKFDRYLSAEDRLKRGSILLGAMDLIEVTHTITACRDPRDNKFLELALSGRAGLILTGDEDLLGLHPWNNIAILSPAGYLAR